MNEDSTIDGNREPNAERFLKSNHVLIEIHLKGRRRRGGIRHGENLKNSRSSIESSFQCRSNSNISISETQISSPEQRRFTSSQQWRRGRINSPDIWKLQNRHFGTEIPLVLKPKISKTNTITNYTTTTQRFELASRGWNFVNIKIYFDFD